MPASLPSQPPANANHKSKRLATVQQQSDWSIVDQTHIHVRLKSAGFNLKPLPSNFGHEGFIKTLCLRWPSGLDKAWSSTFATIAKQCELTDNQHSTIDVVQCKIHLSIVVLEDSQAGNLFRESDGVGIGIVRPDAKQYQKPSIDLADDFVFDSHAG